MPSTYPPLFGRVLVITGPTASGKTEIAIEVARRSDRPIEIISLDSMAVYRGMDIGTAKPTPQQRCEVPHHLIDVITPDQSFSVAEYLNLAHQRVREIESRGHLAMFVGGTPMYLKAILRGFDPGPPADEAFRENVAEDVRRFGLEALRERLRQVDPLSAAKIDPHDERRMTRALEFSHHTGRPISHHQIQFETAPRPQDGLVFALQTPRELLHQRIERRVNAMTEAGLFREVCELVDTYGELSKTARAGVGYREWLPLIGRKDVAPAEFVDAQQKILFHTRRLARRQETWIRSFPEIRMLATQQWPRTTLVQQIVSEIDQLAVTPTLPNQQ